MAIYPHCPVWSRTVFAPPCGVVGGPNRPLADRCTPTSRLLLCVPVAVWLPHPKAFFPPCAVPLLETKTCRDWAFRVALSGAVPPGPSSWARSSWPCSWLSRGARPRRDPATMTRRGCRTPRGGVHDRRRPQPPMVEPGKKPAAPPADAIILFDGQDLSQWQGGNPSGVEQGCINILKTGEIRTKRSFGDCQLHIEWATPAVADGDLMNWGNSGVFFLARHEPPSAGAGESERRPRATGHRVSRQPDLRRRHRRGHLWPDAAAGERRPQAGAMANV